MIERNGPLSLSRQCALLDVSRSSQYYRPKGESAENLALMRRVDELHMAYPFYGSRQLTRHLRREGVTAGRHRIRRLMRLMGVEATYRRPRTSVAGPEHRVFPYLLRGMAISRADHCVVRGHHLCSGDARLFLPRGRDGLGDPARARVAAVEHDGRVVPRRGSGRRAGLEGAGDLEPGFPSQWPGAILEPVLPCRGRASGWRIHSRRTNRNSSRGLSQPVGVHLNFALGLSNELGPPQTDVATLTPLYLERRADRGLPRPSRAPRYGPWLALGPSSCRCHDACSPDRRVK